MAWVGASACGKPRLPSSVSSWLRYSFYGDVPQTYGLAELHSAKGGRVCLVCGATTRWVCSTCDAALCVLGAKSTGHDCHAMYSRPALPRPVPLRQQREQEEGVHWVNEGLPVPIRAQNQAARSTGARRAVIKHPFHLPSWRYRSSGWSALPMQ